MRFTSLLATAAVASIFALASHTAHAQATIYYNFDAATPTTNTSSLTASALTQGNNNGTTTLITTASVSTGYTQSLNGNAVASGSGNAGAAAFIGALDINTSTYFQFSLTANAGFRANVTQIGFGERSTGTGPQAYSLRSSLNNYATEILGGTITNDAAWRYFAPSAFNATSTNGGTITFRLYGYNGAGNAQVNTANFRIDDLSIVATAQAVSAAPEPGALGLLLGAAPLAIGIVVRRRMVR